MNDMDVTRVKTDTGTHVEPPLDEHWDDLTKLHWHAAVCMHDCEGLRVEVIDLGGLRRKVLGKWRDVPGMYSIGMRTKPNGWTSSSAYTFDEAWIVLNGISKG